MPTRRMRAAFTLIELLVVIALIALLVSILVPSLNRARELARRVPCMTNENGLGKAIMMYVGDNGQYVPPYVVDYAANSVVRPGYTDCRFWADVLMPYFDPSAGNKPPYAYGFSAGVQPRSNNYNQDANHPTTKVIYSRRMNCPARKNSDDFQFWYNFTDDGFSGRGMSWRLNLTGGPNLAGWGITPLKIERFKRVSEFCVILENQQEIQRNANGEIIGDVWPMFNFCGSWYRDMVIRTRPHLGMNDGLMLDGSIRNLTIEEIANAYLDHYPFGVP